MSDFNSEYDAAVALADAGQNAAAHQKLKQLYDTCKLEQRQDVRFLLWLMYTAPTARTAFVYYTQAANVAPDSEFVEQANTWYSYKYGDIIRPDPVPEPGFWPTLRTNLRMLVPLIFLSVLVISYALPNVIGKLIYERNLTVTQARVIKIEVGRTTSYEYRDATGKVYPAVVSYGKKYQRVGDVVSIYYNPVQPYYYSFNPYINWLLLFLVFLLGIFSIGGTIRLVVATFQGKRLGVTKPPKREIFIS